MPTPEEEFQSAYKAWKAATEAFEEKMRRAMTGEPFDLQHALGECAELDRLRNEWLEKAKPFVRWK